MGNFSFFEIEKQGAVATVFMNQPESRNAQSWAFWTELPGVCDELAADDEVRVVIMRGRGKSFSLGLDLRDFIGKFEQIGLLGGTPTAEQRLTIRKMIKTMQDGITSVARLEKPVIAAIQKHCIGGGLDLISACDIRLCSKDAVFSLREAKVAIVADMGSLQRLPSIIGDGNTRRLAFTGEDIRADRAKEIHLVDEVYETEEDLYAAADKLARSIGKNSGLVLQGIKAIMNGHNEHHITPALENVVNWNAAFMDSKEFQEVMSDFKKRFKL